MKINSLWNAKTVNLLNLLAYRKISRITVFEYGFYRGPFRDSMITLSFPHQWRKKKKNAKVSLSIPFLLSFFLTFVKKKKNTTIYFVKQY